MSLPKEPILSSLTPFTRVLFSILLMISSFAILFFLGLLLARPMFGVGLNGIISAIGDFENPQSLRLLEYFQIIQSIGLFIIPPLLAGYFFGGNTLDYLRINNGGKRVVFLVTIALMFISLPFINWLVTLNESMTLPASLQGLEDWMKSTEEQAAKLTEAFMQMSTAGELLFNILLIAVLPAIGEELVFRGLFQRLFREWLGNIHLAIFLSAFLFSAVHMQFYGFLPRMVLGLMIGYLFYFSGSLWVPILAHFIQNGTVVIVTWLGEKGLISGDYEQFGMTTNGWIVAGSCLFMFMMFFLIRYNARDRRINSIQD